MLRVFFHQVLYGVGAQATTSSAGEDDIAGVSARFIKPSLESRGDRFAKWNGPLLAPFTQDFNMSASTQRDVLTCETRDLRQAQAGLQGQKQQDMVPTTIPDTLVRGIQQRLGFGASQEVNEPAVTALGGHCENALDLSAASRHLISRKMKERAYGGETKVARARADTPRCFKLVQEGGDKRCVDLFKRQAIGRYTQPYLGKAQKEPERVPIRADGVRADPLLQHQTLREELLQKHRKAWYRGLHGESFQRSSSRVIACFMSEGF